MGDFRSDPFVIEAIRLFVAVDRCLPCLLLPDLNHDKVKSHLSLFRTLERLKNETSLSPDFLQAVECELLKLKIAGLQERINLARDDIPKTSPLAKYDSAVRRKIGAIASYVIRLMPTGAMAFISPEGRRTDLVLNVMICVLVEYGKNTYPRENHFSVLAAKLSSSQFDMTGWEKSRRSPRMKIFDRFKLMQNKFDVQKIYADIRKILTPSD